MSLEQLVAGHRHLKDFQGVARSLMLGGRGRGATEYAAVNPEISSGAAAILKASSAAIGTGDILGTPEGQPAVAAFIASMRHRSVYQRLFTDAVEVPWAGMHAATTTAASADEVSEGEAKPVRRLQVSFDTLSKHKAAATVVMTREFAEWSGSERHLLRELQAAVSDEVDAIFLDGVLSGVSPLASSGNPAQDLRALLNAVNWGQGSRLYWIGTPDVAAAGSTLQQAGAASPTPVASEGAGLIDIPFFTTSQLPEGSPSGGRLMLIDATGLTVADDGASLDTAQHASVLMDDDPSMPAQLVSLFQTNSVALRAERRFAFDLARASSIAWMDGITWSTS